MKNTIIYIRTSANDIRIAKQNQVSAIRQYCEDNKLRVITKITDVGESRVDELQHLVKNVDHFVVTGLDRISRDAAKCRAFCQYLEESGIELHLVNNSEMISNITELLATHDSKVRSAKIKAGIAKKKALVKSTKKESDKTHSMPKGASLDPWCYRQYLIRRRDFKTLAKFNRQQREKQAQQSKK